MLSGISIFGVSLAYLLLLFAIAWWGDKRADAGRSIIDNPVVYALSIAVYCTSWTFYGSVGRAVAGGIGFLPIYLGPTLMAILWWVVLRKIVRISKAHRITSIADFVSSRYGKSQILGGLVTVIAVIGIMPYISLQLKAVSNTFTVLMSYPEILPTRHIGLVPIHQDTALFVSLFLAAFAILFGTRHIDASEHHEGMVAAIAFESVVKLVAFLAVGIFVTFGMFNGLEDIFSRAAIRPDLSSLFRVETVNELGDLATLSALSMVVIIFLPRQFQVAVVENTDENHIRKAMWLFPLYLLLINIFVLPIAFAGMLAFDKGTVDPDIFVLALPMAAKAEALTLFVFIGGLSAATGMVIVETIALSIMVCNDLVMPLLFRLKVISLSENRDLSALLLNIRRWTIVLVLLLGYAYVRLIGESYALVAIGLVSFCAAAQFAPVILGGIFWKGGTKAGAKTGLIGGFVVWAYTLLLPSFARSGWLPPEFLTAGPFDISLLKPYALFGLEGLSPVTHSLIWSMLANIGGYILVSLLTNQTALERIQAALFVDVFKPHGESGGARFWRGTASIAELKDLVGRFVGVEAVERAFENYSRERGVNLKAMVDADAELVGFAERMLSGAIGSASARVMMGTVAKGEVMGMAEVMEILDEASQILAYSHKLEVKSRELEIATAELTAANERLKELDRLKDDFISTVTHELRTPLTAIRSFSEILFDNPEIDVGQRQEFLRILISESERLTRLINQVLDLAKLEQGGLHLTLAQIEPCQILRDAATATGQLYKDKEIELLIEVPPSAPLILADRDSLMQVAINLLSNAVKFVPPESGRVALSLRQEGHSILVSVADNGPGIPPDYREAVFEKFRQVGDTLTSKPEGTGLGLAICKAIIIHLGGDIWVEETPGGGANFVFRLPIA
jgi:Na+/proline symporter/signal transduction histidine kinase